MNATGGHAATPNSETTEVVTPGSQNMTSTVPSALGEISAAQNNNDSEATKIVKSSPGV